MDGGNNGNPIKMDDLGVPLFLETPIYTFWKVDSKLTPMADLLKGVGKNKVPGPFNTEYHLGIVRSKFRPCVIIQPQVLSDMKEI